MHPFGGTSICPRCSKAVYAAEQVMGPGRKLYHKPCLACMSCNKRLDSFTLLEHDQEPYCKLCHGKHFGTRDLRQANLPHRGDTFGSSSPGSSPAKSFSERSASPIRTQGTGNNPQPLRLNSTGNRATSPILRPNRAFSPTSERFPRTDSPDQEKEDGMGTIVEEHQGTANATHTGRVGGYQLPRTVPLSPSKATASLPDEPESPTKLSRSNSSTSPTKATGPLMQTSTGTRYGAALSNGNGSGHAVSTPTKPLMPTATGTKQWGAPPPKCPRCGKSVYFAEQVKATGKLWHKGCLRCTECSTLLDSKRLTEKDGNPLCHRCYGKLHGPQGGGYALLGKAGG